jgi:hypothetical protein
MFEIGQCVVCTKPAEETWFGDIPLVMRPRYVPETGEIYTIREIVTGSDQPGGPHWTKAPGLIGLLLVEIVNERRFTTNGDDQEQAFWEGNFMPLDGREEIEVARQEVHA